MYETDEQNFLPHFYITNTIITYDNNPKLHPYFESASSFSIQKTSEARSIFIEEQICKKLSKRICSKEFSSGPSDLPKIQFEKINPTRYRLKVNGAKDRYVLVFSESFHRNWSLFPAYTEPQQKKTLSNYFDGKVTEGVHSNTFLDESTFSTWGKKAIASYRHFQVNGYANAWVVLPEDVGGRDSYSLVVEMTDQRIFYAGLVVSLQVFIFCMLWGAFSFIGKDFLV